MLKCTERDWPRRNSEDAILGNKERIGKWQRDTKRPVNMGKYHRQQNSAAVSRYHRDNQSFTDAQVGTEDYCSVVLVSLFYSH